MTDTKLMINLQVGDKTATLTVDQARALHAELFDLFGQSAAETPTAREVVHGDKPSIFGQEGFDYIDGLVKAANKEKGCQ